MWTTTRSKRQLDSCCLNSDLICILSCFFWQVEDLAQQAECSDIEVLSNVSEKEGNTKKAKHQTKKLAMTFLLAGVIGGITEEGEDDSRV